jgi:hypothetical protein
MKIILHRCKSPFHNKTVDILRWFYKKDSCFLPNSDETEEIKLDNLHAQGWFDSSFAW